MTEESPFKPGARVALQKSHGDTYSEERVEKVYKNGNFTLFGSAQQWHPSRPGTYEGGVWSARPTGRDVWDRRGLVHWSELNDAKITAVIALGLRVRHREKLVSRLEHMPKNQLTDLMLTEIENAMDALSTTEAAE